MTNPPQGCGHQWGDIPIQGGKNMSNMVVRTNVFALNAHRNMKNVGLEQRRSSNRLASGYRINSAADDAAGLAISESMRAQIRGLDQASRNTQDGQAMLLTTEGGLEEIGNMLVRVRELMVQASNDTNTQEQRGMIEQEVGQLGREILSMQNRVEFNSNRVLAMGPAMDADVVKAAGKMAIDAHNAGIHAQTVNQMLNNVIAAIDLIGEMDMGDPSKFEGAQKAAFALANKQGADLVKDFGVLRAGGAEAGVATMAFAPAAAVEGATVADALASLNARRTLIQEEIDTGAAATAADNMRTTFDTQQTAIRTFANAESEGQNIAFFQVGANASQGVNYDFERVSRTVASAGFTVTMLASVMSAPAGGSGIGNGISTSRLISAVDFSINDVNTVRANLGSVQNRMDYTMRSLDISSENLSDSESRVRNADMAREMMRFTMANVLQQSSVSMLAQANQLPNNLLQLLR